MTLPFEEDREHDAPREEEEENLPLSFPRRSMPWPSLYPFAPSFGSSQRDGGAEPDYLAIPPVVPSFVTPMDTISVQLDPYMHRLVIILQQDRKPVDPADPHPPSPPPPPPAILLDTKKGMELIKLLQFTVRELEQY